jgi:hypothetical protein
MHFQDNRRLQQHQTRCVCTKIADEVPMRETKHLRHFHQIDLNDRMAVTFPLNLCGAERFKF